MKFILCMAIVGLFGDLSAADEPTPFRNIAVGGRMAETIAFDPAGKLMVTGGWEYTAGREGEDLDAWKEGKARGVLKLWNASNGDNLGVFEGSVGAIFAVAFSPDGKLVATAGRVEGDPRGGQVKIWDVKTRKEKATLKGHTNWVLCAAFSPNLDSGGKWLATGGFDKTAKVWDVKSGKLVTTLVNHSSFVQVVRFTRDGKGLLTADRRGVVTVWDATMWGGKRARVKVDDFFLLDARISPDGKRIAVAGQQRGAGPVANGQVSIWDIKSSKQIAHFETEHVASSTAFSPDGKWIAGHGLGQELRLWHIATKEEYTIRHSGGSSGEMVTFTPDGKLAFTCRPGMVSLWNAPQSKD